MASEQGLERFEQPEIRTRKAASQRLFEFDQKIEVAARRVEPARHGGAEQVEPADAEAAAQGPQRREVGVDDFGAAGFACSILAHAAQSITCPGILRLGLIEWEY